ITPAPAADFSFVDNGSSVTFTNTSQNSQGAVWDFGNGQTGTGNTVQHNFNATSPVSYDVTLTVQNDCGTDVITKTVALTSINEKNFFSTMKIFPQPNNGHFQVQIDAANVNGNVSAKIVTLQGKEIFAEQWNLAGSTFEKNVQFENVSKGIYFMHLNHENFQETKKIIIQ